MSWLHCLGKQVSLDHHTIPWCAQVAAMKKKIILSYGHIVTWIPPYHDGLQPGKYSQAIFSFDVYWGPPKWLRRAQMGLSNRHWGASLSFKSRLNVVWASFYQSYGLSLNFVTPRAPS